MIRAADLPAGVVRTLGYLLFVGLMAPGYYYNVTFIQLGLHDLGVRVIGMPERDVAAAMGLLALVTGLTALAAGVAMLRWQLNLVAKLRVASLVVAVHALLAWLAPGLESPAGLLAWITVAGVSLGIGVPVTFGMAVDLVPVRHRGPVAAVITAAAYFAAAALAPEWEIDAFSRQLALPMTIGTLGLLAVTWLRVPMATPILERMGAGAERPDHAHGRFLRNGHTPRLLLAAYLLAVATIFFIDSLGFLRLIFTPAAVADTWRSPDPGIGLLIGGVHALGAVIGGILYARLDGRTFLLWIFGIFALVQLMYVMTERTQPFGLETTTLTPALLYALAVSLYTVLAFAVWADLSTPRTVGLVVALGIGLAGWLSTFASTAISLELRVAGIAVEEHLSWVAALAMMAFVIVGALLYFDPGQREAAP